MNISQAANPDARALADLFKSVSVGAIVNYTDMTEAIGRNIHDRRHLIPRALTLAAREAGAIFGSVRKIGYQRLSPQEAHILGANARGRIRRTAKRTAEAISAAVSTANDLPDAEKRRAYAEINSLNLIRHIAADKQVSASEVTPRAEPLGIVMRRFARTIGAAE